MDERDSGTDDRNVRLARLLKEAQAGQLDSLNQIVAELSPLLWQVARIQGLDRPTAEDVVQTTWLRLLRNLKGIRTPESLVSWLITVTKREAWRVRNAGRGEQPVDDWVIAGLRDPAAEPDEHVLKDERRRALWAAFRHLSERCQALLRLVAFAHRPTYNDVATALGMPIGSIGPTRGRCLAKLRDLLVAGDDWSTP